MSVKDLLYFQASHHERIPKLVNKLYYIRLSTCCLILKYIPVIQILFSFPEVLHYLKLVNLVYCETQKTWNTRNTLEILLFACDETKPEAAWWLGLSGLPVCSVGGFMVCLCVLFLALIGHFTIDIPEII